MTAALLETPAPVWTPDGCLATVPARAANDNAIGSVSWAPDYGKPTTICPPGCVMDAAGTVTPLRTTVVGMSGYLRREQSPFASQLPPLVGITGKRDVGKSTVAGILEKLGYERAHAFDGGKEAAMAYFRHVTEDAERAYRMVFGDLKDVPCAELPGGVAPRYFLERFGHFMGDEMGVEWTLGMEIARLRHIGCTKPIVVESLVYEAPWFRRRGGRILRVVRPDHEGPAGVESDSVQAAIIADEVICNDGSIADLQERVVAVLEGWL